MQDKMIFRQLFESETSTYTYIVACARSREAVIIDPVLEKIERDLGYLKELGLTLKYVFDTHIHADHITAAGEIRKRTGAQTGVSALAQVNCVDLPLQDNQQVPLGDLTIKVITTPGHTNSCASFLIEHCVFTGDALMIRGTGRTDFQQGSSETLYHSLTTKIFSLPPTTKIYPGHDYKGMTQSTVEEEIRCNPRVGGGKTLADFKKIMSELKLAHPKKIHEALPANMECGMKDNQVPALTPEDFQKMRSDFEAIIDVRRPDEFSGELGHIEGAVLKTLGPELSAYLQELAQKKPAPTKKILMVCRSGNRSGQAVSEGQKLGLSTLVNMSGGMLRWNELKYPLIKK